MWKWKAWVEYMWGGRWRVSLRTVFASESPEAGAVFDGGGAGGEAAQPDDLKDIDIWISM